MTRSPARVAPRLLTKAEAADRYVTIPLRDYERLLLAAEGDDMIVTCQICGAWIDRDEPACATIQDFTGCWKAATCKESDPCVSYRAPDLATCPTPADGTALEDGPDHGESP